MVSMTEFDKKGTPMTLYPDIKREAAVDIMQDCSMNHTTEELINIIGLQLELYHQLRAKEELELEHIEKG